MLLSSALQNLLHAVPGTFPILIQDMGCSAWVGNYICYYHPTLCQSQQLSLTLVRMTVADAIVVLQA